MKSRFSRSCRRVFGIAVPAAALAATVLVCGDGRASESAWAAATGEWLSAGQLHDPPDPFRRRTIVLLHGFGGSPYDMKPLFDALVGEGFRLVAPLIPGEGPNASGDPPSAEDLAGWLRELLDGERDRFGRQPAVVGFSKGGTLASLAASENRAFRAVLVAPYFGLPRAGKIIEKGSRLISPLVAEVPKPWKGRINDPEGYDRYEPGQKDVSLAGFHRLQELARKAEAALAGPLPVPILVLASPGDDVASFRETERILGGRPGVTLQTYPGSNHVLFYDYAAAAAVKAARDFLTAPDN